MRVLPVLLLLAASARADLASEVQRAFRHEEPGVRAAGLQLARGSIPGTEVRERNRAAAAIEKAMRREDVPAVRIAALDLLLALRTERSLDRLVVGALDPVEEVREHVHAIAREQGDPALQDAIVRALRDDASWRMRAAMVDLLLSSARARARGPLVDALGDTHPGVMSRAAEALYRLTGQALGVDRDAWVAHFSEEAREEPPPDGERRTTAENPRVELHEGPVRGINPTLYTVPVVDKCAIFVVDMSSSMHKNARSEHFVELKRVLFSLPSDVSFNILCFDQRLFFFAAAKSLVPATTEQKAMAERWVNDLPAGEKTDVNQSITAGLAMLNEALAADPEAKAELFILTDGRETTRTTSAAAVARQFEKLPTGRCRVHVIALGRHGTLALRTLADRSGGRYVEVPAR